MASTATTSSTYSSDSSNSQSNTSNTATMSLTDLIDTETTLTHESKTMDRHELKKQRIEHSRKLSAQLMRFILFDLLGEEARAAHMDGDAATVQAALRRDIAAAKERLTSLQESGASKGEASRILNREFSRLAAGVAIGNKFYRVFSYKNPAKDRATGAPLHSADVTHFAGCKFVKPGEALVIEQDDGSTTTLPVGTPYDLTPPTKETGGQPFVRFFEGYNQLRPRGRAGEGWTPDPEWDGLRKFHEDGHVPLMGEFSDLEPALEELGLVLFKQFRGKPGNCIEVVPRGKDNANLKAYVEKQEEIEAARARKKAEWKKKRTPHTIRGGGKSGAGAGAGAGAGSSD